MLSATLPFVFAILWASSYAAAKIGLADITPYAFVAIRLAIAAAAAVLMVLALKRPWGPVKLRWPHLLIGGALVHGLALSTAHAALVSVAATPTALVHAFHPILTAALGVATPKFFSRLTASSRASMESRASPSGLKRRMSSPMLSGATFNIRLSTIIFLIRALRSASDMKGDRK